MRGPLIGLATLGLALLSASAAQAACGCTQMDLWTSGTQTICSNTTGTFGECARSKGGAGTACPSTAYVFKCPTGANSHMGVEQKTGFKVAATYAGGSSAGDCTPGQILQETIKSNGSTVANPKINPTTLTGNQTFDGLEVRINNNASQQYPRVGQLYSTTTREYFGGDNYVMNAPDVISSQSNAGSQWWDNPDQEKDSAGEDANWQFRFIAFVQGSAGQSSCSCEFDIDVDWPSNSNPTTLFVQVVEGSENCVMH